MTQEIHRVEIPDHRKIKKITNFRHKLNRFFDHIQDTPVFNTVSDLVCNYGSDRRFKVAFENGFIELRVSLISGLITHSLRKISIHNL